MSLFSTVTCSQNFMLNGRMEDTALCYLRYRLGSVEK